MHCFWVPLVACAINGWVLLDTPAETADAYLTKQFPADQPGAVVAIVRNGQPILAKGYGLADLASKAPLTPDAVFDLASVSKQFTAMAIMQLAERGRLSYDDEVRQWIPEMPDFAAPRPIRIRDLLNQTSGLTDYIGLFYGSATAFAKLRNDELPALFRGTKLKFDPGTKFDYSNSNYALLPVIVERASGKTFAAWMRDHVFVPLKMHDTRVMDHPSIELPRRATGYSESFWSGKPTAARKDGCICGDGNVFTTVQDVIKWDAGLAANALVRDETINLAYTPAQVPDFKSGKPSVYGFGWVIQKVDRHRIVWHNGRWAGTRTYFGRLDTGLTIAVLSNNDSAEIDKIAVKLWSIFQKPATAAE